MARSPKPQPDKGGKADSRYLSFGQEVARMRARQEPPITQLQLAAQVGLSRESIANIEGGRQQVLLHHALDLARALGVTLADLVPEAERSLDLTAHQELKEQTTERREFVESALSKAKPIPQSRST